MFIDLNDVCLFRVTFCACHDASSISLTIVGRDVAAAMGYCVVCCLFVCLYTVGLTLFCVRLFFTPVHFIVLLCWLGAL